MKPYIDDVLKGTPPNRDTQQLDESVTKQHDAELDQFFLPKIQTDSEEDANAPFLRKVEFCGHILCNGQRMSSPEKRSAIEKWQWEGIRTPNHLQHFLALTQWYPIYMRNYAKYAGILSEALRKLP
jgi:hypothetical protein